MDASKSDSHRFLFLAQLLCFKARAVTLLVCVGTIRVFKALMTKTKKKYYFVMKKIAYFRDEKGTCASIDSDIGF